jgi:hypothetical protein
VSACRDGVNEGNCGDGWLLIVIVGISFVNVNASVRRIIDKK